MHAIDYIVLALLAGAIISSLRHILRHGSSCCGNNSCNHNCGSCHCQSCKTNKR